MRIVPYSNTLETLAWMDEDNDAPQTINIAIAKKHEAQDEYIQLIVWFAPAIKCVAYWNKSRELNVTELLTVSDEAFIIVCLISYGCCWMTMHKNLVAAWNNRTDPLEELPVRQYLKYENAFIHELY